MDKNVRELKYLEGLFDEFGEENLKDEARRAINFNRYIARGLSNFMMLASAFSMFKNLEVGITLGFVGLILRDGMGDEVRFRVYDLRKKSEEILERERMNESYFNTL